MTKLLYVTTVPYTLGFFGGQSGFLRARGIELHALSSPGEALTAFADREGVTPCPVAMTRRITPVRDVLAVCRIRRLLRRMQPEIVHAHTPKGGLLGMVGAWLARVPVRVYHIHGLPLMTAAGARRGLLRLSERVSCLLAHRVLAVSESIRRVAIEERLCPPGKIQVLLNGSVNGVDARVRFNPARIRGEARRKVRAAHRIPADGLVVGFVGRVVRDKGVAELVEAWRRLREEFPDLWLLVVGPFEPQDPVSPDAETALRGDPRIRLVGEDWDTPPLYAMMDVVALPTYREGFGLVCLEAAAMELPVVATRIPGCVDAVQDGVTGTLVPPRDSEALAGAIRAYLNDPDLRRRHGRAGRERVLRDFRPEDMWEALYQEYVRLLRERGLPVPDGRHVGTEERKVRSRSGVAAA